MKMDIVESDLKQLFMWIKNLDELCKSQQVLIDKDHYEWENRVNNIEKQLEKLATEIDLWLTQEENK